MEQRNSDGKKNERDQEQKKQLFSVRDCLRERFKEKAIQEEEGVNTNFLSDNDAGEIIDMYIQDEEDAKFSDVIDNREEDYVGNEAKKLKALLDVILGGEGKSKLIYLKRSDKIFTKRDCLFFSYLLETYNEKDSKYLRKQNFDLVEEEFLFSIKLGMEELAENENTKLTLDDVELRWRIFNYYSGKKGLLNTFEYFKKMIETFYEETEDYAIQILPKIDQNNKAEIDKVISVYGHMETEIYNCLKRIKQKKDILMKQ